jgi:hypothetical protein
MAKQPGNSKRRSQVIEKAGGRDRDRTGDLLVANEALSQLSYSPISFPLVLCSLP